MEYNKNKCQACLKNIGIIGLTGNVLLVFLKGVVGITFLSTALLADALYSLMDIGFSILIIAGLKISSKPPDENHDYGHGKVEFVITIIFSIFTIIGAIALFLFAVFELHEGVLGAFSNYVLVTALISIGANYLFHRYTSCIAKQFFSPSIHSLSTHSKADAISSVLVAISMVFAYFGYLYVGPFVAIIETAHLLFIGSEIFKSSLHGLLDASISPKEIKDIKSILSSIPGIINIDCVKSRKVGQRIWLNLEIEVPASFSISKVDKIKGNINETLNEKIKNLEKVMVNVIPFKEEEKEEEKSQLSMVGSH